MTDPDEVTALKAEITRLRKAIEEIREDANEVLQSIAMWEDDLLSANWVVNRCDAALNPGKKT